MRKLWFIIARIFNAIGLILEYLAMSMLLLMAIIICYQVVMRYCFNNSPSWTEEIAILMMIWFGILSIPIGVKHKLHIGIEYVYDLMPPAVQVPLRWFIYLLIAFFGVLMVIYGIELTQYTSMSTLPATKLSSAVGYVVIPISGVMLVFNALDRLFSGPDLPENEENDYHSADISKLAPLQS